MPRAKELAHEKRILLALDLIERAEYDETVRWMELEPKDRPFFTPREQLLSMFAEIDLDRKDHREAVAALLYRQWYPQYTKIQIEDEVNDPGVNAQRKRLLSRGDGEQLPDISDPDFKRVAAYIDWQRAEALLKQTERWIYNKRPQEQHVIKDYQGEVEHYYRDLTPSSLKDLSVVVLNAIKTKTLLQSQFSGIPGLNPAGDLDLIQAMRSELQNGQLVRMGEEAERIGMKQGRTIDALPVASGEG